jgi:hypothetical protein
MQMRSITLELIVQKILNHILKRKVSIQRIEDSASIIAASALDRRVQKMLALQSNQPLPQQAHFQHLSNPI